ncbi:hypothetical protein E1B28_010416 [Marasmius oreades]|uniref:Uncharacterized protein n=1 Tax=Marasmius oreades TaxID=181124 RepID=A0A9P7RX42_9AGAR|nr:uncharacterized protein E1B28_010416 [Marasmius oreades]KAG7091376.1 hypothetical protein E1B28_010416 [Marasmius oreades]
MHYSRYFRFFALLLFVLCLAETTFSAPVKKTTAAKKPATKAPAKAPVPPKAPVKPPAVPKAPAKPPPAPKTPAKPPAAPPKAPAKPSSAPTTPPGSRPGSPAPVTKADPAEGGCSKQTTCDKCVAVKGAGGKAVCVFTEASKCVGSSTTPAGKLFRTAAECKSFNAQAADTAAADADLVKAAKSEFAKIKPHVFGTEKGLKNTSGRHLASALLSVPANKNLERAENAATGLSKFTSKQGKIKTTWDDDKGKFTQAQVQAMCEDAIKSVLKLKNAKTLPKGTAITSVSVKSPLGGNLCISVQGNTSVFPGSTSATTTAPGQPCTTDSGVSDDV